MASLSFTHFLSLPRWTSTWPNYKCLNLVQVQNFGLRTKWEIAAVSRKKVAENSDEDVSNGNDVVVEKRTTRTRTIKRATSRTRKKEVAEASGEDSEPEVTSATDEGPKKTTRKTRRKAVSASSDLDEEKTQKKVTRRRRTKKKDEGVESQGSELEFSDREGIAFAASGADESDVELQLDSGEDVSYTYGWPPLVCCFGAAQHAFVPSGRPANRLIDHEIHERMKDALWTPEKFVRAPGGCAGGVAVALASLGGKVAFMGKLGDDEFGQAMLYYLNMNNVQTRSVKLDGKRATATSQMKIGKRGRLRMTCLKPCAEDSLSKSEINIDVLRETKMLYVSTHSLLEQSMRSATLHAINISKKLGGVIFYDLNLPMPLWNSSEETKLFIQEVWKSANIIEVTKQELEFLCDIKPSEEFDSANNARSKFIHYGPEVVAPLWHKNLKVLFVTNGTSKIHYYTNEHNGAVHGMEDAPITPFTSDMSASGDGIVAGLLRMLTVQPQSITDKDYLVRTVRYAIDCGVIDQWLLGRTRGFPPKEDMEEEVEPDPNGIRSITEKEYRTLQTVS